MTLRQQWMVVGAIVAAMAAGLLALTQVLGEELVPVALGKPAPAFTARTLDATPVVRTLDDYRGQVVLLNIWATWCGPCRVEMPSMQRLHDEFGAQGLKIVAVTIDEAGNEEGIREFAKEYGLTFEILHDPAGDIQRAYQTNGVPETLVIGRDGTIRKKVVGAANWSSDANRALVRALIGTGS